MDQLLLYRDHRCLRMLIERALLAVAYKLDHLYGVAHLRLRCHRRHLTAIFSAFGQPYPCRATLGANRPGFHDPAITARGGGGFPSWFCMRLFVIERTRLGAYSRSTEIRSCAGLRINVRLCDADYGFGAALAAVRRGLPPVIQVSPLRTNLNHRRVSVVVVGGWSISLDRHRFGLGVIEASQGVLSEPRHRIFS